MRKEVEQAACGQDSRLAEWQDQPLVGSDHGEPRHQFQRGEPSPRLCSRDETEVCRAEVTCSR